MQVTSLGQRTDLMIRRLGGSEILDRGDHLVIRTPANPGFRWGNYLLLAQPPGAGDLADWLAEFSTAFPAAAHVALAVDGTDGRIPPADQLAAAALTPDVCAVLRTDRLTAPAHAAAAVVRPLTAADLEPWLAVRLAMYPSRAADASYREFAEGQALEALRMTDAGHGGFFGAFVEGTLRAQLGIFTDGSGVGRFQEVETHPQFRRRGLAGTLLQHAADYARHELGARTLVIVADPHDEAIRLYRALGFTEVERMVRLERAAPA